jgi:Transposase C of IS166 homeodomain
VVDIDLDRLPDEPALLQQMLRDVVTAAAYQHGELHAENDKLRMLIKRLLRHRFGRRSEQLDVDQLQFGLEDLEQTAAANQAGQEAADAAAGRQRGETMPGPIAIMVRCQLICRAMRSSSISKAVTAHAAAPHCG